MDPPPDFTKYNYHGRGDKEKCTFVKMKDCGMKVVNSLQVEELTRSSLKKDSFELFPITRNVPHKGEVHYPQGPDNFKITVNSSSGFLLNTAVSVTVDFNPCVDSNAKIQNISDAISKTLSSEECEHCCNVDQCYSKVPLSLEDKCSNSANAVVQHSLCSPETKPFESKAISELVPSQKRSLSPNDMASPCKRKKSYSSQKNKILRYLIRTDVTKEKASEERKVTCTSPHTDRRVKHENDRYIKKQQIIGSKNESVEVPPHRSFSPEVISISSDEESDTTDIISSVNKRVIKEEIESNLSNAFSVLNFDTNDKERNFRVSHKSDYSTSQMNSGKGKNHFQEICIVSSDEDGDYRSTYSPIVDLTCDNSGSDCCDDNAFFQRDTLGEEQYLHKTSSSSDVITKEKENDKNAIEDEKDICAVNDEFHVFAHKNDQIKSGALPPDEFSTKRESEAEYSSCDIVLLDSSDSQSPVSLIPLYETGHSLEQNDSNSEDTYINWVEGNRNGENICLEESSSTTGSPLPSPPAFGDIDFHKHQTLPLSCKLTSNNETSSQGKNKEIHTDLITKSSEFKRHTKIISDDSEGNISDIETCSEISEDENFTIIDGTVQFKNGVGDTITQISETSEMDHDVSLSPKTVHPSAERVCRVQAEVFMSKLYQPWLDLGSHYIPKCCIQGPDECNRLHAKKQNLPEEVKYNDDIFIVRMQSLPSAIDFVQFRIDHGHYPTSTVMQNLILCALDSGRSVAGVVVCLLRLLHYHPPCVTGMLDYYKKIFFNPVQKMDAPDGIFWWCVNKIEEIMYNIKKETVDRKPKDMKANKKKYGSFSDEEVVEVPYLVQLEELFKIFECLISVMEADLNVGLIKNMCNLKRYTSKSGRPLIAVSLWGAHGIAGPVNAKCRRLIKMYFTIFGSYRNTPYLQHFKRLISLMAGVVYASERNTLPPKYPNIGLHCKEFTNAFSSIMMASALNMIGTRTVLKFLKPDWFRFCVCSNLVETLYGRNMDMSLQPAIALLKNLDATNQQFPSQEEMSCTTLGETESDGVIRCNSEELCPNFVKKAMKKDKKGETQLHITCRRNHVSQLEKLLSVPNINVNEKDNIGWTPLHEAALHGNTECVKLLLNFRTPAGSPAVDLHIKNSHGVTPLMDAVSRDRLEIAFLLLQHGGPKLLLDKNDQDHSPWDLAHTEEMKNILKNTPDESIYNGFVTIPRTLFIKLAVLTPLAIFFYIKFSEVVRISLYLKNNIELKSSGKTFVKFRPVTFKQDYLDVRTLQAILEKMSCNSELLELSSFCNL